MVRLVNWIPYDRVDGFPDQVLAVLGVDGRWRLHAMTEFGFDESLTYGADTGWAGSLSPDGRWWMFPLSAGARPESSRSYHLLDLRTANLREIHSATDERVDGPVWTSNSKLAFDWREGGEQGRRLVDPASGDEVETRGFVGRRRNLIYAPDGRVHQLTRRNRELVTYDETLEEIGRSEISFDIPGDRWRPAAAGRRGFAFLREGVGSNRSDVLVIDSELTPTASLQVSAQELPWHDVAWIDAETVVLSPVLVGGEAPEKLPVTVWRPATGEVATIATAIAAADPTEQLTVQVCPGALAKPT